MVGGMDAVGVDCALLVSPFTMYWYDASYAIAVHAARPGRIRLIWTPAVGLLTYEQGVEAFRVTTACLTVTGPCLWVRTPQRMSNWLPWQA